MKSHSLDFGDYGSFRPPVMAGANECKYQVREGNKEVDRRGEILIYYTNPQIKNKTALAIRYKKRLRTKKVS